MYVQRIMGIADKRLQSQWEWLFMSCEWPIVMNGSRLWHVTPRIQSNRWNRAYQSYRTG